MNRKKLPEIFIIKRVEKETEKHFTLFFEGELDFNPGQFVMLWLPGVDEKPFTLSYHGKKEFGITIELKGEFTKAASMLKKGDKLGIRGPFGNGFSINESDNNICIIAGGCGFAPVAPLIDLISAYNKEVKIIYGARTKKDLLFTKRFPDAFFCTDDGTLGFHGSVTEILVNEKKLFNRVYTCGPELMMKKVVDICLKKQIQCEFSLERYMKCGIGVCASCVCASQRVCVEGPVFSSEKLSELDDFGNTALLKSGEILDLKTYFSWRS